MGFFDLVFGKGGGNRTLENKNDDDGESSSQNKGLDLIGGLTGTGRYAKTEEEIIEKSVAESLKGRIGFLKMKKYKDNREPTYNDNNTEKRLEFGQGFNLRDLPGLVYKLANSSSDFRRDIGGRFNLRDRDKLKYIMKNNRYVVSKMKQKLNHRDEGNCKADLSSLFN